MTRNKLGSIATNEILCAAYSDKNTKYAKEVSLGETSKYLFTCAHCHEDFKKKPNDFNRREAPLYWHSIQCGSTECKSKATQLNRKQMFIISSSPSFKTAQPSLANEFISFTDPIVQALRSLDDVPEFSHLVANWQCEKKAHHRWTMKLSARSTNPKCPYCPGGDKTHHLDSIYQCMLEKNWLCYLDPKEHKKAKMKKIGVKDMFNFTCKRCGTTQRTSFGSFTRSEGCKACLFNEETIVERRKKRIKDGAKCIADYPEFANAYCYDQPDIPEDKRNKTSPFDMPIGYESVFWQCAQGHITSASPKSRIIDGAMCNKCGAQTSRMECIVFTELKERLTPLGYAVFHRFENEKLESDIFIKTPELQEISIEIDGVRYHKAPKKLLKDIEKDEFHHRIGIRTLRIREYPLEPLPSTQKTFVTDFKDYLSSVSFVFNDLNENYDGNLQLPESILHQDKGLSYYTQLRNVPLEESVGHLFPELVDLVDQSQTSLSLYNVKPSSRVEFPWLDEPDGQFLKWDKINNRIRNGKITKPKESCNQKVTAKNCVAATHPHLAHCFVDPTSFVFGTSKKVDTYCCHPHTIEKDGRINTHGKEMCGVITKRRPIDVYTQINGKGFCWNKKCEHENHIKISPEVVAERSKKIIKNQNTRRKKMLKQVLGDILNQLPLSVAKELLKSTFNGITCPHCKKPSYIGQRKESVSKLKEQGGYECYWCFSSSVALNKKIPADRKQILKHKNKIVEFESAHADWKIDRNFNKYGLSFEPRNADCKTEELIINLISPLEHRCKLPLSQINQFDSSVQCICPSCTEKNKKAAQERRVADKVDNILTHLYQHYPNVKMIKHSNDYLIVNCGHQTKINEFSIPHADFSIYIPHALNLIAKYPELCPCCAHTKNIRPSSCFKMFGFLQFQMRYAEALLNIKEQGAVEHPTMEMDKHQIIKTSGKENKFIWSCANKDHTPVLSTADNFTRINKQGYCKECLKGRGISALRSIFNCKEAEIKLI